MNRLLVVIAVALIVFATLTRSGAAWHVGVGPSSRIRATKNWAPLDSISILQRSFRLFASATTEESSPTFSTQSKNSNNITPTTVPITLLSGFLGTGKTTTLKHLLENTQGTKIGVIVNDVASVNIDAKLVKSNTTTTLEDGGGMVELQNGCACCSLADELFFSVDKILTNRTLDAIVVELSGVADPNAIRKNWLLAPAFVKDRAFVSRVVTLLDAATFGTDFMTLEEARQRKGWMQSSSSSPPLLDTSGMRKVSELLAEQVEAADVILLNKLDLASKQEVQVAKTVAEALNPGARFMSVEFGKVSPDVVLGTTVEEDQKEETEDGRDKNDPNHSHSHSHDHDASGASACDDPDCDDPPSHQHHHTTTTTTTMTTCNDPDCTDTSHSHSHSHDHRATATDRLGISNFVFKATRPFHPDRLATVLDRWPVPVKDTLDLGLLLRRQGDDCYTEETKDSPFVGVLRSKGFCWVAPNAWSEDAWRHDTSVFWSHAGKSFGLKSAGRWWATVGKEEVKKYFVANLAVYEKIVQEDFVTEEFGDRRNELVFIGINLDEEKIRDTLERCLYSEEEMKEYREQLQKHRGS